MKINRYITRGISEHLSLDLQILLWNMVKERDYPSHTDYLHILNYKKIIIYSLLRMNKKTLVQIGISLYKLCKNQNALPKKVYVIREDDVDVFIM